MQKSMRILNPVDRLPVVAKRGGGDGFRAGDILVVLPSPHKLFARSAAAALRFPFVSSLPCFVQD